VGLQYEDREREREKERQTDTDRDLDICYLFTLSSKRFLNYYCLHKTAYTHFPVVVNQPLQERILVHVVLWV
jgi:hypothetical protein